MSADSPPSLDSLDVYVDKHAKYVRELSSKTDTFEYCVTEHLRMSGMSLGLLGAHCVC